MQMQRVLGGKNSIIFLFTGMQQGCKGALLKALDMITDLSVSENRHHRDHPEDLVE